MNYVGKPLSYVLATPARPDDADNPLRLAFGNEAGDRDIAAFARALRLPVVDGFGSTENAVVISRIDGHAARIARACRSRASPCSTPRPSRSARARSSTRPDG